MSEDESDSCDLSELSEDLFHCNELEALKKIQEGKKAKIFYNERIRTTNYILSSKFEKKNHMLDEELEQIKRNL